MMVEVHWLHHNIFSTLRQAGATMSSAATDTGIAAPFTCFCGNAFATHRGLLAHQRKSHQIFSPERIFLNGATCLHCGKYFWTTQRLQQHLSYIPRKTGYNVCFHALQAQGLLVDYRREDFPDHVLGVHRKEALQTAGPMRCFVSLDHQRKQHWHDELDRCRKALSFVKQPCDPLLVGADIGDQLTACTMTWFQQYYPAGTTDAQQQCLIDQWMDILCGMFGNQDDHADYDEWVSSVFMLWGEHWLPDIQAQMMDGQAEIDLEHCYAQALADFPRYQTLIRISELEALIARCDQDHCAPPTSHRPRQMKTDRPPAAKRCGTVEYAVPRLFAQQAFWQESIRADKFRDLPQTCACPVYQMLLAKPVFLVIHLFSGRRRLDDFHDQVLRFSACLPFQTVILSCDTAVSFEYGDLSGRSPAWRKILQAYQAGRVAATLCGPPCETFSEARFNQPEVSCSDADAADAAPRRWPRPLRSAAELFGLSHLTLRELKQCSFGSQFFLQCLWILALHMRFGGSLCANTLRFPNSRTVRAFGLVQWYNGYCSILTLPCTICHNISGTPKQ